MEGILISLLAVPQWRVGERDKQNYTNYKEEEEEEEEGDASKRKKLAQ